MTLGRRVRRGAGTRSSRCASTLGTCSLVWDGLRAPLYCVSIWGSALMGVDVLCSVKLIASLCLFFRLPDLIGDTLAHPSNIEKLKEDAKKQRGEA